MLWWKNEKMTNITTQALTMILNESEESEVSWGSCGLEGQKQVVLRMWSKSTLLSLFS